MPMLTGETIIRTLRELYGYEIAPADAEAIARSAGALLTMGAQLKALGIDGVESPFGFEVLASEATRIAKAGGGGN
jgi:hypothetical protein